MSQTLLVELATPMLWRNRTVPSGSMTTSSVPCTAISPFGPIAGRCVSPGPATGTRQATEGAATPVPAAVSRARIVTGSRAGELVMVDSRF
ncbi:hypothetical protein ABWH91_02680 [Phycisphaerales bacterium ac7]